MGFRRDRFSGRPSEPGTGVKSLPVADHQFPAGEQTTDPEGRLSRDDQTRRGQGLPSESERQEGNEEQPAIEETGEDQADDSGRGVGHLPELTKGDPAFRHRVRPARTFQPADVRDARAQGELDRPLLSLRRLQRLAQFAHPLGQQLQVHVAQRLILAVFQRRWKIVPISRRSVCALA